MAGETQTSAPHSYVNKTTKSSSEYAEKVAESFGKRRDLMSLINQENLPKKTDLNWKVGLPYIVQKSETKGVLDILKTQFGNSTNKLNEQKYIDLAYWNMMDIQKANNGDMDVNVIEAGDKIYVREGVLYVNRKSGSSLKSFGVSLYPWDKITTSATTQNATTAASTAPSTSTETPPTPPATVVPPPVTTPSAPKTTATPPSTSGAIETSAESTPVAHTDNIPALLEHLNKETDPEKIKAEVYKVLDALSKKLGIYHIALNSTASQYDFVHIKVFLPRIIEGIKKAQENPATKKALQRETIFLGRQGGLLSEYGPIDEGEDVGYIQIDYDESPSAIAASIHKSVENLNFRKEINKIFYNFTQQGYALKLFPAEYDYADVISKIPDLKKAFEIIKVQESDAFQQLLKTTPIYLKPPLSARSAIWDLGMPANRIRQRGGLQIEYTNPPQVTAHYIIMLMKELHPELKTIPSASSANTTGTATLIEPAPGTTATTSTPETPPAAIPTEAPLPPGSTQSPYSY